MILEHALSRVRIAPGVYGIILCPGFWEQYSGHTALGTAARWRGGAVARWRGGSVARWRGGAVARWRGDQRSESQPREFVFGRSLCITSVQSPLNEHMVTDSDRYLCTNSLRY